MAADVVSVYRSADFQSAVSPICNRQRLGYSQDPGFRARFAGYKPAIQQTTSLRYECRRHGKQIRRRESAETDERFYFSQSGLTSAATYEVLGQALTDGRSTLNRSVGFEFRGGFRGDLLQHAHCLAAGQPVESFSHVHQFRDSRARAFAQSGEKIGGENFD